MDVAETTCARRDRTPATMEDDDYCVVSSGNGVNGTSGQGELVFEDEDLVPSAMRAINMMRKNKHFCDVVLHTGNAEVPAHRAVLAAASPYLFELFTTDQDRSGGSGATELPLSYKLSGPCERKALVSLVDYAYTGKLCVPAQQVRSVYLCAWQLRMDSVVHRCGLYLAGEWLSKDTCISVRALPGLVGEARSMVDKFIAENFASIYEGSLLSALPLIQVEVLYTSRKDMDQTEHGALADLMLNWLRDQITDEEVQVSALCDRTHLLYIAGGGELKDCAALPPAQSDTPLLQDYRRMILKCPPSKSAKRNGNGTTNGVTSNGNSKTRISTFYLRDILERAHRQPGDDWSMIVCERLTDHTFLSLCTLDGHLALISASLRLNESPIPSPGAIPPVTSFFPCVTPGTAQPLGQLERPRCAYGLAVHDGKLIICGGYDRAECLKSVESYDPEKNRWNPLPDMRQQRGRFNIAKVGNRIFAVGGSDGHVELDSVEMFVVPTDEGDSSRSMTASLESQSGSIDLSASSSIEDHNAIANGNQNGAAAGQNGLPANILNGVQQRKKAWTKRAKLPLARSYAGVCGGPEGRIYCIGGWAGQPGIRDCHVYDTEEDTWSEMPSLNTARYQGAVCVWAGSLWVIGGCDAWHCLGTTEIFRDIASLTSSEPGSWHPGPSLSVARRGCGAAVWGSKLVVAGGSDGQHSLRSVEILTIGGTWEPGPPMREKRAGVSLATLNDRLYAVGGFSGKLFLSSMEYLVEGTDEWTSLTVTLPTHLVPHENGRGTSPAKQDQEKSVELMSKLSITSENGCPLKKNTEKTAKRESTTTITTELQVVSCE